MMKNNYEFWHKYLSETINKLDTILLEKTYIYTDFHMHSNHSSDGQQTLEQIIIRSQELGLDVISITDHDSIKVYDDLYEYLKHNKLNSPIIIPGVEFTVENDEYGSQFHVLQFMINPKEKSILQDIYINERARWIRVKKQFIRISENETLQYFFNKYNIQCSEEEYKIFLNTCSKPIPEYSTLFEYLMKKLTDYNITVWDVFNKLKQNNNADKCKERKDLKEKRYKTLQDKYKDKEGVDKSPRFLHSMLAVRGVDDDYFPQYKSCGSLSVNNFNELRIEQLNKNYITIIAHPNESKLNIIHKLQRINNNISGMEYNKQTTYSDSSIFFNMLNKLNMIYVIGSDSHENNSIWYNDMEFYKLKTENFKKFLQKAKKHFA